jgi:glycerol dehydrogenase
VQGPGALSQIGEHVRGLGTHAFVFVDAFVFRNLEPLIKLSCQSASIDTTFQSVSREVTDSTIDEELAQVPDSVDFIIGVGGGKTIDIAKGVALRLGLRIVTAPTIASNDSPASRAIAMYNDDHLLTSVPLMPFNPSVVLVDTSVVFNAPARFLSAGIGDALSKHFEVAMCQSVGGLTPQGTQGLQFASIVAAGCLQVLRRDAPAALTAVANGYPTQEFENTVEAVILLSGLSFENGGLSVAHAMTRGLMVTPGASSQLHGEHVAYGLLVQLALQDETDEMLGDMCSFFEDVKLPRSLRELHADSTEAVWSLIAQQTCAAPHIANFPIDVNEKNLVDAIRRIERLAVARLRS